jgi:DNA polymerase III delta prime subunit
MQTLRTTIKISEETKSTNQNIKLLQGQLDRNTALTMKTLETSEQTLMVTLRTDTGMQELLLSSRDSVATSNELLRRQDNMIKKLDEMQSKDNKDKQRNLKSGASRPVNFERLKIDFLNNSAEGVLAEKLTDMKLSYCDRLFEWIEKDIAFGNVINEMESLLWVSGAPGMGKSTLSYRMLRSLEERYSFDTTTCVAWFSFDEEHAGMRSVGNMLRCCSIRAAEKDARYCSEILAALRRESLVTDEDAWTHLIESRYTKDSRRRLIIVLDGIDEIDEEDFPKLINFLGRIRTQQCAIQAIFTCDPDKEQDLSVLEAKRIELTRNKIIRDMRMFAWSRIKTLSRLRKLRITLRKTIVRKIMRKADCKCYHVSNYSSYSQISFCLHVCPSPANSSSTKGLEHMQ